MSVEGLRWSGLKNPYRVRRLIHESIKKNNLDLTGLTVFTEAASKNFVVTPIIAAMAGAKVYAITNTSRYGSKESIRDFTLEFAEFCGVSDKIEVIYEKDEKIVNKANIITNLGFVRPIDKELIDMMNDKAVIPYMYEAWEFRKGDIDLQACESRDIPVMATDEGETFDFCGPLCIKMLLELEIEVLQSKIAILSNDFFGGVLMEYIQRIGGEVYLINDINKMNKERLKDYDALIMADYKSDDMLDILYNLNLGDLPDGLTVLIFAANYRMYKTLADLGPKPVIDLNCAGLKVGEVMARARLKGKTVEETKLTALLCSPAQRLECD